MAKQRQYWDGNTSRRVVEYDSSFTGFRFGGVLITNGTAAPTTGTWKVGDQVWDSTPVSGQPMGWVCSVAGTPGTWVAMANYA